MDPIPPSARTVQNRNLQPVFSYSYSIHCSSSFHPRCCYLFLTSSCVFPTRCFTTVPFKHRSMHGFHPYMRLHPRLTKSAEAGLVCGIRHCPGVRGGGVLLRHAVNNFRLSHFLQYPQFMALVHQNPIPESIKLARFAIGPRDSGARKLRGRCRD